MGSPLKKVPQEDPQKVKTLLVLLGPTGVGKTALSMELAQKFACPILNADSRQIYRDIPIGTAAPSAEDLARVRHFFVGTLSLEDYLSAASYEEAALGVLQREFLSHEVCILSGGSMMYIDAVCKGLDQIPSVEPEVRASLSERLQKEGLEPLRTLLRLLDPAYYDVCDLRNPKRVVHALEVCLTSGKPFSSFLTGKISERPFRIVKIGLERPRAELFERINRRVSQMVAQGFLEEARRVLPFRACNSLNTVGYKEIFCHFDGQWPLELALNRIRKHTRVYAKKQILWFKKDPTVRWFHPEEVDAIDRALSSLLS